MAKTITLSYLHWTKYAVKSEFDSRSVNGCNM